MNETVEAQLDKLLDNAQRAAFRDGYVRCLRDMHSAITDLFDKHNWEDYGQDVLDGKANGAQNTRKAQI